MKVKMKSNTLTLESAPMRMKRSFRAFFAVFLTFAMLFTMTATVLAEDTTPVVDEGNPVNLVLKLAGWLLDLFAAVGVIVVIISAVYFFTTLSSHDTAQRIQAGIAFGIGAAFFSLRWIINFLAPGML